MEVYEAIRTVLATRSYRPESIPEGIKRKILEAGRLTASSMNLQPWQFIVIESRERLGELGSMVRTGAYTSEAGMAVAVIIDRSEYAVSDASRAIQSMILTAWSEGVASNWVGFFGMPGAKDYLDIPDELELFAIVPFGYSDAATSLGVKNRKPFSEIVHSECYGSTFEK